MNSIKRISFVGYGNVAWHLAMELRRSHDIAWVTGPNEEKARSFALKFNTQAVPMEAIPDRDVDLILICTPDDTITAISSKLTHFKPSPLIVHTSGVSGTEVFDHLVDRQGCFYPLNTFTKGIPMDMSDTPIFIEADAQEDEHNLSAVARGITNDIRFRRDYDMGYLHLSAVFANNFSNAMISIAEDILKKQEKGLDVLMPLIRQTINKLNYLDPKGAQTGPAIRKDVRTMQKHLDMLPRDLRELYKMISDRIQQGN